MYYLNYNVNRGDYHDHKYGGVVCECCLHAAESRREKDDRIVDSENQIYRKVRKDAKPRACWSCVQMVDETIHFKKEQEEIWQAEMEREEKNIERLLYEY